MRFPEFEGEWVEKRLGEIAEYINTKIPSDTLSIDNYISTENMLQNYEGTTQASSIPLNVNVTSYKQGDVLVSNIRPYLKKIWKATYDGGCSSDVLVLRNNELCLNEFLYHLLANDNFINHVMAAAKGVKMPRGDKQQIQQYSISLPSIFEQHKIATFLYLVDDRINKSIKIIEELKLLKATSCKKILSQELRFKEENGEEFMDWEEVILGNIADRIMTKNKFNNKNVLTISAQYGLINQLDFFNKSVSAKDLTGYYILRENDFAYNKSYSSGYPMGAIKRLKNYSEGVVSTLYICFRFRAEVNISFMEQYFEAGIQNTEIEKVAQEGARNHGLLNIGIADFFNISLTLPCYTEQTQIANFLSSIDEKINLETALLQQLINQKQYLLQQMFI